MRFRLWSALFLLGAFAPAAFAADTVYPVRGVVRAPLRDGEITVAHRDIPGLMPAMTMPFRVEEPDRAAAAELQAGDEIEFKFAVGDASRAYDFRRVGRVGDAAAAGRSPRAARLREGDEVPAFSLTDQAGRPFRAGDLRDRWTVLTFIFTRCPVPEFCPRMSQQFAELQRRVQSSPPRKPPVQLASISFDPAFDTPEVLKAYGEGFQADPAIWRLCTGSETEIRALVQRFAVHVERNPSTIDHTLATALIGPDGRVRQIWRGNQWTAEEVLRAIDAPAGRADP